MRAGKRKRGAVLLVTMALSVAVAAPAGATGATGATGAAGAPGGSAATRALWWSVPAGGADGYSIDCRATAEKAVVRVVVLHELTENGSSRLAPMVANNRGSAGVAFGLTRRLADDAWVTVAAGAWRAETLDCELRVGGALVPSTPLEPSRARARAADDFAGQSRTVTVAHPVAVTVSPELSLVDDAPARRFAYMELGQGGGEVEMVTPDGRRTVIRCPGTAEQCPTMYPTHGISLQVPPPLPSVSALLSSAQPGTWRYAVRDGVTAARDAILWTFDLESGA